MGRSGPRRVLLPYKRMLFLGQVKGGSRSFKPTQAGRWGLREEPEGNVEGSGENVP